MPLPKSRELVKSYAGLLEDLKREQTGILAACYPRGIDADDEETVRQETAVLAMKAQEPVLLISEEQNRLGRLLRLCVPLGYPLPLHRLSQVLTNRERKEEGVFWLHAFAPDVVGEVEKGKKILPIQGAVLTPEEADKVRWRARAPASPPFLVLDGTEDCTAQVAIGRLKTLFGRIGGNLTGYQGPFNLDGTLQIPDIYPHPREPDIVARHQGGKLICTQPSFNCRQTDDQAHILLNWLKRGFMRYEPAT